jgi:hypothetical protein
MSGIVMSTTNRPPLLTGGIEHLVAQLDARAGRG